MAEFIDKQAAIDSLLGWAAQLTETYGKNDEYVKCLERAANNIEQIPAADVRPVVKAIWKHVKWVVDEEWQEGGYWISRCSNCSMPYHTETPFCPHCGADRREKS